MLRNVNVMERAEFIQATAAIFGSIVAGRQKRTPSALAYANLRSTLLCNAQYGVETSVDVFIRCRPITHANAHRRAALPQGAAAPTCTVFLNRLDGALGLFSTSEGNQDLV